MKAIILTTLLLGASSAMAFEVSLSGSEKMTVDELVKAGATEVLCEKQRPLCILQDTEYGIMYPGQELKDVEMTNVYNANEAIKYVVKLKESGLCE